MHPLKAWVGPSIVKRRRMKWNLVSLQFLNSWSFGVGAFRRTKTHFYVAYYCIFADKCINLNILIKTNFFFYIIKTKIYLSVFFKEKRWNFFFKKSTHWRGWRSPLTCNIKIFSTEILDMWDRVCDHRIFLCNY